MKKLFISALAIVSMVACSMDETVNTQAPASIAFDGAFVEKATRAEDPSTTTANINEFYVWAVMNEVDGLVFNGETGETVTKGSNGWTYQNIQYWTPSKSYYFAALAGNLNDVELALTADNGMVSKAGLTNLAAFENKNGTNDLLYAESVVETPAVISAAPAKVKFQFAHLLSKVKFSFTNGFQNKNNYIVIENITMAVPATGEIDLTADELAWANQAGNLTLAMGTMDNAAKVAINETAECDFERLTIPATAAQEYTVKFDVTLYNGNQVASTAQKTVKISGVELKMGHSYNFKATINKDNVDENPLFPIEFDVEVDEWIEETVDGGVVATNAVSTEAELAEAIVDGGLITLAQDIVLTENATLVFGANANTTRAAEPVATVIDLAGHTLSGVSTKTGANFNMIDVNGGNLTIKNGAIVYEHKGANMEWNSSTNIFNVTAGGVLNLDGVTAKNLGGSDMGFVAHLNNSGKVTLNVENSTLESNYVAVRVFNSGNDINNVAIHNSTLKGGNYAFWVHNYTVADFGSEEKAEAQKALLNLDIFNGTNTFVGASAAARMGMTNRIELNENGAQIVKDAEALAACLKADSKAINVVLANDIELPISSLGQITGGSGEYKLGGENTEAITIDLNGKLLNVTTTYWSNLGAKNANALFTIKNGKMTSSQPTGTWNSYDLSFSNCNYNFEDVVFEKAIALCAANKAYNLKNVTINETHDYYAMWVEAVGQTVTIDGLTVNSAGRGIKIDEQYVSAPAKVTMNIANATFTTAKKAAIVVKSVAGAEINAENLNIAAVAADDDFAVWVDEAAAAYADQVVVNGAYCKVEGVAATIVDSASALTAALNDSTVSAIVLAAGDYGVVVTKSNKTIIGSNGANVDAVVFNGSENVTIKNIVFDAATAQISYDGSGNAKQYALVMNDNNGGKNTPSKGASNIVIDGCTFEGTFANGGAAIAFTDQSRSSGFTGNVTVKNCTFNTVNSYYDVYGHYCGNGLNGYGDFVIENNVFKSQRTQGKPVYLGRYASSTPVVVAGNTFETAANLAAAVTVQDHSSYGVSVAASNNTFAN